MKIKRILATALALLLTAGVGFGTTGSFISDKASVVASALNIDDEFNTLSEVTDFLDNHNYDEAIDYLNNNDIYYYTETNENDHTTINIKYCCDYHNKNHDYFCVKEQDGFLYLIDNNEVEIMGYVGNNTKVNIPETINGLPVKRLSYIAGSAGVTYDETGKPAGGGGGGGVWYFDVNQELPELNMYIPETVEELGHVCTSDINGVKFNQFRIYFDNPVNITYKANSPIEKFINENKNLFDFGSNVHFNVGEPFADDTPPVTTTTTTTNTNNNGSTTTTTTGNNNNGTTTTTTTGNNNNGATTTKNNGNTNNGGTSAGTKSTASTSNPNTGIGAAATLGLTLLGLGAVVVSKNKNK